MIEKHLNKLFCKTNDHTKCIARPNKESIEFKSLSPKTDIDISVYEDAINYARKNDGITNVALTGNYGSGKSSILFSYEAKNPEVDMMHIELPHYKSSDNNGRGENTLAEKASLESIEGKIINQLLAQIDPQKIPLSVFKASASKSHRIRWTHVALIFAWLLVTLFLKYASEKQSLLYMVNILPNKKILLSSMAIWIIASIMGIICISKWLSKGWRVKGFRINSGVVNFEANKDTSISFFDKYMNDVLYLFEESGCREFVFEDLDRFDIPLIYERLHELNILLNKRSSRDENKKIIFFYMLRDNSFVSKDRSKIFDFIIPVIPVISSDNSYQMIIDSLGVAGKDIPNDFLRKLSVYIDDMRLLLNIANEFKIYYLRLSKDENLNDPARLLGIITYKNIFPRDFADSQNGRGFVNCIIDSMQLLIKKKINSLTKQKEEKQKQLDNSMNDLLENMDELDSLYLDFSGIYSIDGKDIEDYPNTVSAVRALRKPDVKVLSRSYRSVVNSKELLDSLSKNEEYSSRKGAVFAKNKNNKEQLIKEIHSLSDEIIYTKGLSLSELLRDKGPNYFVDLAKDNGFVSIVESSYFSIISFLFRNDSIDEHYYDYIEYFYPGELSRKDKTFLRNVFDNLGSEYTYSLDSPDEVLQYLSRGDITRYKIMNVDLSLLLLRNHDDERLDDLFNAIKLSNGIEFTQSLLVELRLLSRKVVLEFLEGLIKKWPDLTNQLVDNGVDNDSEKLAMFILDLLKVKKLSKEVWNPIDEWLRTHTKEIMSVIPKNEFNFYLSHIKELGSKFANIKSISNQQIEILCSNDLVEINNETIDTLLDRYVDNNRTSKRVNVLSKLRASSAKGIMTFVRKHELNIVQKLLDSDNQFIEKEETVAYIITLTNISDEMITTILDKWTSRFEDIGLVTHVRIWEMIVNAKKMVANSHNLSIFFKQNEYRYNNSLTSVINEEDKLISFENLSDGSELFDMFIKVSDINDKQFISIIKSLGFCYESYIPKEQSNRIPLLIQEGIIKVTLDNVRLAEKMEINIAHFANKNIEKFLSFADKLELTTADKEELVIDASLSDGNRSMIIKWARVPVELSKFHYGNESLKSVLYNDLLRKDDVTNLIYEMPSESENLHGLILESAAKYESTIDEALTNQWNIQIIKEYLVNNTIPISQRRQFFLNNLKKFILSDVVVLLAKLDYPDGFEKALRRNRPKVRNNPDNLALYEKFRENDWVTVRSIVNDNFIQLYGRKIL